MNPLTAVRMGLRVKEDDATKIKVISFGERGGTRTAQVVIVRKFGKDERRQSVTRHLHYENGRWVHNRKRLETEERKDKNGKPYLVAVTVTMVDLYEAPALPSTISTRLAEAA